jgi:FAD/FMN-containing dehydrogenase
MIAMSLLAVIIIVIVLLVIHWCSCSAIGRSWDFAHVHFSERMHVFSPTSPAELIKFVEKHDGPLCIRGAGYSHGGNTLVDDGVQIDMKHLKQIAYNTSTTSVTVQGGCTWNKVIAELVPYGRTVAECQSYYNFSVGGSIAVNCHGRGTTFGSVSDTILSMEVLLADGSVVTCDTVNNYDLFRGTIGGYSLLGIILEATLMTVPNSLLCIEVTTRPVKQALATVLDAIKQPNIEFFNVNLYPRRYHEIISYSWVKVKSTDAATATATVTAAASKTMQPSKRVYWVHMLLEQIARRTHFLKWIRAYVEPTILAQTTNEPMLRSYVMAEDANKLSVLVKRPSTTVLQEYFVPVRHTQRIVDAIVPILPEINLLNVSIRYVRKVTHCVLNYAPEDMVAIVLYFNMWNNRSGFQHLKQWTRRMLDIVRSLDGTFYLPYLLCYDPCWLSYGAAWEELTNLKHKYDPTNKWQNKMQQHMQSACTGCENPPR